MKKNVIGTVFSICSAVFYILAIIGFSSGAGTEMSAVWLCLGSAFLCIGPVFSRRANEEEKKEGTDEETLEDIVGEVAEEVDEDAVKDADGDVSEDETEV